MQRRAPGRIPRVRIGSGRNQGSNDSRLPPGCRRLVQRRGADGVLRVHVRPGLGQNCDHQRVPGEARRHVEGSLPAFEPGVHIRAEVQAAPDLLGGVPREEVRRAPGCALHLGGQGGREDEEKRRDRDDLSHPACLSDSAASSRRGRGRRKHSLESLYLRALAGGNPHSHRYRRWRHGTNFAVMLRTHHPRRIRKPAAVALLLQLAVISGLSVVEASHNHFDTHTVQWHSDSDEHPGDGQSAHAQCVLCAYGGACMSVANRACAVYAPTVHGVRAYLLPNSRLAAVDAGFSTRPRAPPGHLI